jgi:hypothetical protein
VHQVARASFKPECGTQTPASCLFGQMPPADPMRVSMKMTCCQQPHGPPEMPGMARSAGWCSFIRFVSLQCCRMQVEERAQVRPWLILSAASFTEDRRATEACLAPCDCRQNVTAADYTVFRARLASALIHLRTRIIHRSLPSAHNVAAASARWQQACLRIFGIEYMVCSASERAASRT